MSNYLTVLAANATIILIIWVIDAAKKYRRAHDKTLRF